MTDEFKYFRSEEERALDQELPSNLQNLKIGIKKRLAQLRNGKGASLDDLPEDTRQQLRFTRYYEARTGRQDSSPVVRPNTQLGMRGKPPRQRLPNT